MTTTSFDASLDLAAKELGPDGRAVVIVRGKRVAAAVAAYRIPKAEARWALVTTAEPVDARWQDGFEVLSPEGRPAGRGLILFPSPGADVKPARRRDLLERLAGGESEMILVLAEVRGIRGVSVDDVRNFSGLDAARVEELARGLEAEAKVRILSFSPLSFLLQDSLDFLCRRVAAYLAQYHKKHPGQRTVPFDRIEKKFGVAPNVLNLALRMLAKEGRVSLAGGAAELVGFRPPLSAEDEKILAEMESLFLEGELAQVSLDDIRRRFRLNPGRLQRLLAVLVERKKIVEGRDGFILHSRWLDEVVAKLRASGRRELTVADFKALTGLSRKYAIPLLELLDEMGVTRRKGAVRDILK
ncbi:MAG TPA: SelB C-terminal domain-containing protein [Burkholderiales bacterium]|nr:SelB C-terminal domain-containing protein [Burkholderiales bacterium]